MRYLSKILTVILIINLTACNNKTTIQEEEYIEPLREVFIVGQLDEKIQNRINNANGEKTYQNYQFKMMYTSPYQNDLKDINGNIINLLDYDKLIFEVVSIECNHCKKITKNYLEDYIKKYPEYKFVQYFDDGDKDEVVKFYQDLNKELIDYVVVIPKDEKLHRYIYDDVGMKAYPTTCFYLNNELRYSAVGELDPVKYDNAIDLGFVNPLEKDELVNSENESILEMDRTIEDVRNSFSEENRNKIETLSTDLYTAELTYKLVGNKCDFNDRLKGNDIYFSEIKDYEKYKDAKVVLLYTLLEDESETNKIDFINDLIKADDSLEYIVIFIESYTSSSSVYKKMNKEIEGAPIVSILGEMPVDFYNYGIVAFPSAVFIDRSTFVGAYSKISDVETFKKATEMFLSENSIAYLRNN